MHACGSHNIATVDLLLEEKASLHSRSADGKTVLMQAFVGTEDMKLVRHLAHRHAAVDAVDKSGWSLLFYACDRLNLELIRWLYTRYAADLESPTPDGTTAAELLRRQGLGQPHRWLGRRRRSDMDYLLIDLGLLKAEEHREGSRSPPTSARGPESSEPLGAGRRRSKRSSLRGHQADHDGKRLSVHSKESSSSSGLRGSRKGSKGEGTDSTELPLSLPAEATYAPLSSAPAHGPPAAKAKVAGCGSSPDGYWELPAWDTKTGATTVPDDRFLDGQKVLKPNPKKRPQQAGDWRYAAKATVPITGNTIKGPWNEKWRLLYQEMYRFRQNMVQSHPQPISSLWRLVSGYRITIHRRQTGYRSAWVIVRTASTRSPEYGAPAPRQRLSAFRADATVDGCALPVLALPAPQCLAYICCSLLLRLQITNWKAGASYLEGTALQWPM
ncbi:unnamed protein product [Symbiodinium sp. KB8]|nr:unnamed protein product [Symbiodinium sp. KB8]